MESLVGASLTVVGTGIKCVSHLTVEAQAYIKQTDLVLYLVNEPEIENWIKKNSKECESLRPMYNIYDNRLDSYNAISNYIIKSMLKDRHVCVVLYGHPTIFANPGCQAAKTAESLGAEVKILPGISSQACLFSDLKINPGEFGLQSFDATDFLINNRKHDARSHLLLWQIYSIGFSGHVKNKNNFQKNALEILLNHLSFNYPDNHLLTLYEASQYPYINPLIKNFKLKDLANELIPRLATLYIPPIKQTKSNKKMLASLGFT